MTVPSDARTVNTDMKLKSVLVWVLAAALALEFSLAGLSKVGPHSPWIRLFASWGFPAWAPPVVGAVELLCGLGLAVPRARRGCCAALLFVMTGAVGTHLLNHETPRALLPLTLAALLAVLRSLSPQARSRA